MILNKCISARLIFPCNTLESHEITKGATFSEIILKIKVIKVKILNKSQSQ